MTFEPLFRSLKASAIITLCAIAGLIIAGYTPPATAQHSGTASDVVRIISEKGIQEILATNISPTEKTEHFRTLFTEYFDIPSIGRFVLGRTWQNGSPEEQTKFLELFREINVYTWSHRFSQYSGQTLTLTSESADGDKGAFVDTQIDQDKGAPPIVVRWRLRQREDGWKIVDLIVEGVSMALTYRSDYNALMASPSMTLSKLNERLEQQVQRLKSNTPA